MIDEEKLSGIVADDATLQNSIATPYPIRVPTRSINRPTTSMPTA